LAEDGPFGSSTPSSKKPFKKNTTEESATKQGGAKAGHAGHGRKAIDPAEADRVEEVDISETCPQCGDPLLDKGFRDRSVLDSRPMRARKIVYRLRRGYCLHYLNGMPIGRVCEQVNLGLGTVIEILHRMGRLFEDIVPHLTAEYRDSLVRHADETSWRTDGNTAMPISCATPTI
jgi:hypothetical protein